MTRVRWSAALESGVPGVDQQHEEMFRLVNEFLEACAQGKGTEAVTGALGFLTSYCRDHFAMEERLMRQHEYPDMPAHVKLHGELLAVTDTLKARVSETLPSPGEVIHFADTLRTWLVEHISDEDMKLVRYLRARRDAKA
jgi:hemerythrin